MQVSSLFPGGKKGGTRGPQEAARGPWRILHGFRLVPSRGKDRDRGRGWVRGSGLPLGLSKQLLLMGCGLLGSAKEAGVTQADRFQRLGPHQWQPCPVLPVLPAPPLLRRPDHNPRPH